MFATGLVPALILFFGTLLLRTLSTLASIERPLPEAKSTLQKIRGNASVSVELAEICSHVHHGHATFKIACRQP